MNSKVQFLRGVGPKRAALLASLGIHTVMQLLTHYPRRYEDRSNLVRIAELAAGMVTFGAVVKKIENTEVRRRMSLTKATVVDASGEAELVWFNQPYIKKAFPVGSEVVVTGKAERRYGIWQINAPEAEIITTDDTLHVGRIVPFYPANAGLSQQFFRRLIKDTLDNLPHCDECMPQSILEEFGLDGWRSAINAVHFPDSFEALSAARRRLVFEELYYLQYGLLYMKRKGRKGTTGIKHARDGQLMRQAAGLLPFTLTADQNAVLKDIKSDMEDILPMRRLLQGDVGSGKTIVAALALIKTVENGYQGAFMAPTEILAEQHCANLQGLFTVLNIRYELLSGRVKAKKRQAVLAGLQDGSIDVVIGTHALLQDDVVFAHLGLVVTDEQHRFGVQQRLVLQKKGGQPDVLVMTATPIPRTMALTLYGDLDVSAIRSMPPGRKTIKTYVVDGGMRERVYKFIVRQTLDGRQAYIVCPLIEESEKVTTQAATALFEELKATWLRDVPMALLHGRLKATEKEKIMQEFYQNNLKVLIATTVIEVGVNVPNATVMLVEDAQQFGLAQLHQLRGRVGRGEHQSYCILLSDNKNPTTSERLNAMQETNDGFELAEKDLILRGPGQFFGMRQHGLPDLKLADVVQDAAVLLEARQAALQSLSKAEDAEKALPILMSFFGEEFKMIFCS